MTRHIGLLGGTFDPPHLGHLVVAETVRVELGLDEVRLVVAAAPWMKQPHASPQDRLAMVQQCVAEVDGIVAEGLELDRQGPTYTIDTVEQLREREPGVRWSLIIGADLVGQLHRWHRSEQLRALIELVVVNRPVQARPHDLPDGSRHVEVPMIEVSSSELRQRFADGRATRFLVPLAVDRYVRVHGLYGASDV